MVYACGLCDEEIRLYRGYPEKTSEIWVGVKYKVRTDDRKVTWEAVVEPFPVVPERPGSWSR